MVRQRGVTNITRTGSPSETRPPLSRRLGELRGVLSGHAEALAERLLTSPPSYETVGWEKALDDLGARFGNVAKILEESALREVEESTRRLLADIRHEDPYVPHWAADSVMARCCYLACRLIEPDVVVETGVAYGVSSAFILKALEENGRGTLYSVDLPPLRREADRSWGVTVPNELRGRWRLHRGTSARILPRLLRETPRVDLFVHDSLHTHRNMRREFDTVWPRLRNGGLLLADDVERNYAFGQLRQKSPALWRVVKDREVSPLHGKAAPVVFGIAIK
ncbi:MAG: class I SAM-dependent methyltransferase [Rubrobacter sp.]